MTIEQLNVVDFTSIDKASGDVWLTITDHLPWDKDEVAIWFSCKAS